MGASASIYWDAMNDELTEEDVKMILADEFDQVQFDRLRDKKTGLLQRTTLMEIIHNHKLLAKEQEVKEVYLLFMQISPKGEMTRSQFITFCKEAKLLSKKNFQKVEADIMFEKALKVPKIISKTMNFPVFMSACIPLIAEKLKLEVEAVIHRLASVENDIQEQADENELLESEDTKESAAARLIQTTTRRKVYAKQHKGIMEVQKSALSAGPEYINVPDDPNHKDEIKIRDVFITSCGKQTDMDLKACLQLCKNSNIVNGKFFTAHDVQLVFLKAKAIATNNEAYKSGIIVNKKMNYKVFREILIPCLAEKKTSKPPSPESIAEIKQLLKQVSSDNVEVETEGLEALKSFFTVLRHGPEEREITQMNRVLDSP